VTPTGLVLCPVRGPVLSLRVVRTASPYGTGDRRLPAAAAL